MEVINGMNKSESKYYNTSVKMDMAFLDLLNKKDFEFITVKDICKNAGVNRSTFYLHYETVADLLEETVEYINKRFASYFKDTVIDKEKISELPLNELFLITPQYLTPWLNFIKDDRKLFETFEKHQKTLNVSTSYTDIFENIISPILARFSVSIEDREYIFLYYVEGIIGIVKKWIREGCERSIEEISEIITRCIKGYGN